MVLAMQKALLGGLTPDITILLDHDIAGSITRARARSISTESNECRFEKEENSFFERVQTTFRRIAARDTERVFLTDARRSIDVIRGDIMEEVSRRFDLISPELVRMGDIPAFPAPQTVI